MNVILFDSFSPNEDITIINQKRCPEALLRICNVPDDARHYIKNNTYASLISKEGIFVRGVNSSFYQIEINKEKYYVHEQYIRHNSLKDKQNVER